MKIDLLAGEVVLNMRLRRRRRVVVQQQEEVEEEGGMMETEAFISSPLCDCECECECESLRPHP